MPAQTLLNGEPADCVSLFDRGCQYGDGLFETIAVREGTPCLWPGHLSRLQRGAERLAIPLPPADVLLQEVSSLCKEHDYAAVKMVITAGRSERGYARSANGSCNRWVSCRQESGTPPWADQKTLRVQECSFRLGTQPQLAGIKHLNRLEQVLARRELREDSDEAILADQEGRPVEGIMSNLLLKFPDYYLTPSLNAAGVAGTVRQLLLDHRERLGIPLKVAELERSALFEAEALFMTNALRGICPVGQLEEHRYRVTRRSPGLDTLHQACFTYSGEPACAA